MHVIGQQEVNRKKLTQQQKAEAKGSCQSAVDALDVVPDDIKNPKT